MIERFKYRVISVFSKHYLPRWLVLLIDVTAVFLAFQVAYSLRYNLEPNNFSFALSLKQGSLVSLAYLLFMLLFKSYSGLIRQTTIKDTFIIAITNSLALLVSVMITLSCRKFDFNPFFNIPISILMIHFGAVTISLIFFRVFIKMFYVFVSVPSSGRKNVIIYGAGEAGLTVKRVIESDPRSGYQLRCFIDDNVKLKGKKLDGFPVFSKSILNRDFIDAEGIKVFIFAIKDISATRKKTILESVIDLGLEILEIPAFDQWLNGKLLVRQLRKVSFEDLLGRDPITLDLGKIENGLEGKTILVTGAAGSIGSELVRQLAKFSYKHLVLVDQAETPSFYLDNELKENFSMCDYDLVIGDITNKTIMENVFYKYSPNIVFHAAAYKHVPIMEDNPHEAFRVNVGGTKVISDLAIRYGVEKFVMISSDKAVNPVNVMGATKRLSELLVQHQARKKGVATKFVITRFGNVLGSNGSVIPLFNKQISSGGPVTITDPEITRYFMTIPEACQLVLEAGFMGNGGEIFIFDMGAPIKILDIAIKLIQLSGLEPYKDIAIKFIGLRPGEKLYEELFLDNEKRLPTHNPKISIARVEETDYAIIGKKIEDLLGHIYTKSGSEIIKSMKEIIPEYTSRPVLAM